MPYLGVLIVVNSCMGDIERSGHPRPAKCLISRDITLFVYSVPIRPILIILRRRWNSLPTDAPPTPSTPRSRSAGSCDQNPNCAMSRSSEIGDAIMCLYSMRARVTRGVSNAHVYAYRISLYPPLHSHCMHNILTRANSLAHQCTSPPGPRTHCMDGCRTGPPPCSIHI